ncbi:hypothetical protein VTN77DRAFT_7344 [Rasamsonia byssochlamydoides]|uniref:uncharacterized protein n=1 Tax=Rasamsonia byssochlamydoides TaxID=89139 RepID=UPI003743219C
MNPEPRVQNDSSNSKTGEPEPGPEPGHSRPRHHRPRLPIRTYHCRFCSHLLVATTQDILSGELPRRREPAGDRALILPLPSRRALSKSSTADENDVSDEEREDDRQQQGEERGSLGGATSTEQQEQEQTQTQTQTQTSLSSHQNGTTTTMTTTPKPPPQQQHYTILLSTTIPDRKPTIIRREDGFEKRILLRCGRCRVVIGYVLDEEQRKIKKTQKKEKTQQQQPQTEGEIEKQEAEEEEEEEEDDSQIAYILPGALVSTEDLGQGPEAKEQEKEGGGGGRGVDIPIEKNPVLQSFEREWREWLKNLDSSRMHHES